MVSDIPTCGSTSNGQRLPRVTITPLAVLNKSAGSPWMFQSWTVGGAARKPQKSKLSLEGMFSCFTCTTNDDSLLSTRTSSVLTTVTLLSYINSVAAAAAAGLAG